MKDKNAKGKEILALGLFFMAAIGLLRSNFDPQILNKEDIVIYEDIIYSVVDGYELKLDIAVPKYLKELAPAIVDIPGGSWRAVKKSAEDALFYAKHGFIGISITHRTSDIAIFPAAVHDCKTVIRWLRAHAREYNIDPDRIGVTGFSSGGHLAALLGTSGGNPFLEGKGGYADFSSSVQAVVDHFGPTDFFKMNDSDLPDRMDHFAANSPESLFLGGPLQEKAELARLANPIVYIDPEDPPVLIGHGEKDGLVIINQSELLFEALKDAGVPTDFIRVVNADHMYRPYKWDVEISPTIDDMNRATIEWFEKWLGKSELDTESIPARKSDPGIQPTKETHLYYRLTLELPGKTGKSFCRGRFQVRCEGEILAQGIIEMKDLSYEEKRLFKQELVISGRDLDGREIMWNFRGEIYDSELNETFEINYMQGEKYDSSLEGVGYHIHINEDKKAGIEKRVYRR